MMGFEPANGGVTIHCLTTWLHPPEIPKNLIKLERIAGIEPAPLAWKARALPLCNIRVYCHDNKYLLVCQLIYFKSI